MSLNLAIHLARAGAISAEQLVDALAVQLERRPQLGQLALEQGLLSMSQVFEVLSAQTFEARPFGAIAVDRGFLTSSQLASLLMKQQAQEPNPCEILVEMQALTAAQLDQWSTDWKRANRRKETIVAGRHAGARIERPQPVLAASPA